MLRGAAGTLCMVVCGFFLTEWYEESISTAGDHIPATEAVIVNKQTDCTHIYCLFCQVQKTGQIAEALNSILNTANRVTCISPRIVQRCWVRGKEEQRIHNYLPGYLFLYAEEPIHNFLQIRRISGVLRVLGCREDNFELTGSDRGFACMLQQMNGTVGIMKTVQIGERVTLDRSAYAGFTGEVIKLDRRKKRAQIHFEFDGSAQKVWVGYEMVSQAQESS